MAVRTDRSPPSRSRWPPRISSPSPSVESIRWPLRPEMAVVRGDPSKGAYDMLVRYKPGFDSGWHTHDAGYRGMVLEGTITNPVQGDAKPRQLAKGGYWYQPAGQNHATRCVSDTACLVFAHSDGGMTYHPTTADGKPGPLPKVLEATSGAKK